MDLNKLLPLLKKNYDCNLWHRYCKCRLYFNNLQLNVTIFLELKLIGYKVIDATPTYIYEGNSHSSDKWIDKYSLPSRKYIDKAAYEVHLLINQTNCNVITEESYKCKSYSQRKHEKIRW